MCFHVRLKLRQLQNRLPLCLENLEVCGNHVTRRKTEPEKNVVPTFYSGWVSGRPLGEWVHRHFCLLPGNILPTVSGKGAGQEHIP